LQPNSPVYTIPTSMRLTGLLDVAAIARSLSAIMRRHEALRTIFAVIDGQPVQVIAPAQALPLPLIDLQALPEAGREAMARRLASEEAQRPFDLERGPLLRASLLRLGAAEHMLLLNIHHIASDGWSGVVFMRELSILYAARLAGQPAVLPELPIQYADYAIWQREWLQGVEDEHQASPLQAQLAYWRARLAGLPVLHLPTDHPRPAITTFQGALHSFGLPPALGEGLLGLSRREGATLFMTLLAAWKLLLARYSGQDDIMVGTPIANRTRAETEPLIGFFVNTLVLRTDLAGNPSFREVLRRTRATCLEAYVHQDLPFEQVVEALQPTRDLSRNPLFQISFALQNTPGATLELPNITVHALDVDHTTAKFDLTLELTETAQGLAGRLEYRTDLFEAATIARMAVHLETLLHGIVANPAQRLADLPLLTEGERRQLLVDWNATAVGVRDQGSGVGGATVEASCIHQLFEAQAAQTPDMIALVFEDRQLTYRELNARANQLAHHLRALGVGPEVRVGLCMERSPELVIGIFGILKAGGAYVPLDPTYPPARLAFMLEDAQVRVLITHQRMDDGRWTMDDLGASDSPIVNRKSKIVNLSADWPIIAQQPPTCPASGVTPANLAYVIYTSGSTGRPKGVLIAQQNLVQSTWTRIRFYREPFSSFLLLSSVAFDSSVVGIFWPLCQGAQLVLPPEGEQRDVSQLAATIMRQRISHILSLPSLYALLLEQTDQLESLRMVSVAGEACPAALIRQHQARLPQTALFNEYGPTEGTVWSSVYDCRSADAHTSVPIGHPIANTQIYLLDAHLQPVPIGVPGELYIGGSGLARGYFARPDLTAARFVPNPFAGDKETSRQADKEREDVAATQDSSFVLRPSSFRLYKTGDLARYWPDGSIEYLGRLDQQVKLRGYRIELGEIELMLGRHPSVQETVVLAREDVPGDTRLVAYLVQRSGIGDQGPGSDDKETSRQADKENPNVSLSAPRLPIPDPRTLIPALRAFLKEWLPDYMVPTAFVLLESLPITPNGKVDRRALPAAGQAGSSSDGAFVAPRTALEEILAAFWAEVLRIEQVSIHDSFFDLGGQSLLATQVISRVRQAFQVKLTVSSLFMAPTVASLAGHMIADESQPGQMEKIARILKRVKGLSSEDMSKLLEQAKKR